jgi:hypothetical protein
VLTSPLTEAIDHAGYFIQMALASLPQWMEFVLDKKYPKWREVERNEDGSARYMPAGVRVLEKSLLREYAPDDVLVCFPDDLDKFIGPNTRVHAQPAGRHVRCRCIHFDYGLVKVALEFDLLPRDVRQDQGQPVPQEFPGDRGRVRRLADYANQDR